jgi:hypothetical protein
MKSSLGVLFAAALVTALLPISGQDHRLSVPALVSPAPSQEECEEAFEELMSDQGWYAQLMNPTYRTREAVVAQLTLYARVYGCLAYDPYSLSDEWLDILTLIEYYLIFVGGLDTPSTETSLIFTDLTVSDDPAIVQLRDEAGVPPPVGFIYVRFFSSREAMPYLVRQAFENEEVVGVTILSRYVAVLNEDQDTLPEQYLLNQTLPETISHELTHAYVSSLLGSAGYGLPTWYHEGLAIYFSGSGEDHILITDTFTVSRTSTEEYKQYDLNFKFLEAKLGRQRLLELILLSIETADSSVLLHDLGITSEAELVARVEEWQQQRMYTRLGIGGASIAVLVFMMFRLMPQNKCSRCGYGGRREFVDGYCPKCGRYYR